MCMRSSRATDLHVAALRFARARGVLRLAVLGALERKGDAVVYPTHGVERVAL